MNFNYSQLFLYIILFFAKHVTSNFKALLSQKLEMQTFTNYKVDSNVTDDFDASGSYSASFGVSGIVAFLSLTSSALFSASASRSRVAASSDFLLSSTSCSFFPSSSAVRLGDSGLGVMAGFSAVLASSRTTSKLRPPGLTFSSATSGA